MSKKQREKVEDEVRYHQAQMRAQSDTAPDSSVFDTQTPSSSDQLHHGYNGYVKREIRKPAVPQIWLSNLTQQFDREKFLIYLINSQFFFASPVTTHIQMKWVTEVLTEATQHPSRRNKPWAMIFLLTTSTAQPPTSRAAPSSTRTLSVDIVSVTLYLSYHLTRSGREYQAA